MAKLAIVGGETLLGKEVKELVELARLDAGVNSFSTDDAAPPLTLADLKSTRLLLLAGSGESSATALELSKQVKPAPIIVDICGGLEEDPATRVRAPMAEPSNHKVSGKIQVIAHPAAIALALFLERLQGISPIRRSIAQIFEPASERGKAGIDELQQQTVSLLSFRKLTKSVFDTQVSFNMVPRYGEDAPKSLEDIEQKIDRHLASLLANAGSIPMPSLRLIQAPVFHGYSFSVWVEFEDNPGPQRLAEALASPHIEVRQRDQEPPSNVGATGQNGITVGAIATDRNDPRATWFWIVADNLRLAAENAVEVAREILAK